MRKCCFPIFPENNFSGSSVIRIFRRSRYEMRVFSDFRTKKFRPGDGRIFLYKRKPFCLTHKNLKKVLLKIGKSAGLIPRPSESQVWLYYFREKRWFP